jgi:hypothetical protein
VRLGLGLTVRYSAVGVGVDSALQCGGGLLSPDPKLFPADFSVRIEVQLLHQGRNLVRRGENTHFFEEETKFSHVNAPTVAVQPDTDECESAQGE